MVRGILAYRQSPLLLRGAESARPAKQTDVAGLPRGGVSQSRLRAPKVFGALGFQPKLDGSIRVRETKLMTAKAEQLKAALIALTPEDRAELARFLVQSLDEEDEQGVEAAWDEELKRRAVEIESGRVVGEPAENVLRELRAKYS